MDFTDVIAGRCTLEDAVVQHPKYPKLHLLTAPLSARPVPIAPEQMKALLDRIRQTYDYCLIDAPAGLGMGFHLASDYADRRWWSPTPTPPPCGTPSAPSWSWTVWDGATFIWWWAGWRRSCCEAFTPPSTTPWTQRVCRCWAWYPEDPERPLCPEHRHPLAGVQQLRRKGLREYCTAHHGAAYPPDAYLNP